MNWTYKVQNHVPWYCIGLVLQIEAVDKHHKEIFDHSTKIVVPITITIIYQTTKDKWDQQSGHKTHILPKHQSITRYTHLDQLDRIGIHKDLATLIDEE